MQKSKLNILFRFDDFTLNGSEFHNTLIEVFTKNNIPINLGIIPFDKNCNLIISHSNSQLQLLNKHISIGLIEIALHGYIHKNNLIGSTYKSEFEDVDLETQANWLKEGKQKLEDYLNCKITTFIPPFHSYDENTLNALDENNFKGISSGYNLQRGPVRKGKIKYLPDTLEDFEGVEDFKGIENLIAQHQHRNLYLIILFHEYSFNKHDEGKSNQINFEQLDSLLKAINRNSKIKCTTFSELINSKEKFDYKLIKTNLKRTLIKDLLNFKNFLISESYIKYLNLLNLSFHLVIFFLLFFAVTLILNLANETFIPYLVIGFTSIILLLLTKFNFSTPKRKLLTLCALSVVCACLFQIFII